MKDTLSTAILTIIALILACLFGFWIYTAVQNQMDSGDQALDKTNQMTQAVLESDITEYDGKTLKGSAVISAIKKFESNGTLVNVVVNNGNSKTEYVYQSDLSTKISSAKSDSDSTKKYNDKSDLSTYINPSATFQGSITRDEATDTIITVEFDKIATN